MAKIMLVEDDNNLREIYEARLLAEGHEIISAHDGEEALAIAVREKPELIISDVMMPKISGFDMLDILRSSPETKNTKIIMMTALSQLEDKDRADRLGADRYLVKSQVTLEDVINVANEVLQGSKETEPTEPEPIAPIRGGDTAAQAPTPATPIAPSVPTDGSTVDTSTATAANDINAPAPVTHPVTPPPAADPVTPATPPEPPMPTVDEPKAQVPTPETPAESAATSPADAPQVAVVASPTESQPVTPVVPEANPVDSTAASENPPTEPRDISINPDGQIINNAQTVDAEQGKVEEQISNFINSNPSGVPNAAPDPEAPVISTEESIPSPAAPTAPEETPASVVPDGFIPETPAESAATPPAAEAPTAPEPQTTPEPTPQPEATDQSLPESKPLTADPASPSAPKKVIQPLGDPLATPDLEALVAKEEEKEQVQKILTDAELTSTSQPATEQPSQKPDDPNAIAL